MPFDDGAFARKDRRPRRVGWVHPSDFLQILTSKPYPVSVVEALQVSQLTIVSLRLYQSLYTMQSEALDAAPVQIVSFELEDQGFKVYNNYQPEALDAAQVSVISLVLNDALVTYDRYQPEALDAAQVSILSLALNDALITYDRYQPEALDAAQVAIVSLTLT